MKKELRITRPPPEQLQDRINEVESDLVNARSFRDQLPDPSSMAHVYINAVIRELEGHLAELNQKVLSLNDPCDV